MAYFFYAKKHKKKVMRVFINKRGCEMLEKLLPIIIVKALENYNVNELCEIRLRRNAPVVISIRGKNIRLTKDGTLSGEKVYVTNEMLEYVLRTATENSLYAYNNQIKQGFITAVGGIRLGIAGESVNSDYFMPTTIKNINSINIRVPHEVNGCSMVAFKFIYSKEVGIKNTLIISPPGAGKTTLLRDISKQLSSLQEIYNTLLVDERFEIASTQNGKPLLNVGEYTDIVSGATKMFAFTNGIRSLRPDVIITDELMGQEDTSACIRAIRSGVKVIASVHADGVQCLRERQEFRELLSGKFFDRYIVLSNKRGVGTYEGIYDENLKCIFY